MRQGLNRNGMVEIAKRTAQYHNKAWTSKHGIDTRLRYILKRAKKLQKKASEAHGDRTHNLLTVREGCVFGDAEKHTFGV
jgi:hypothetical protein